jgi:alkylation response protein AidB-like acyl-CoA dehydrogenase
MTDVIRDAKATGEDDRSDYLDRARSISGLVGEDAAEVEKTGKVTQRVFEALRETELFWLLLPKEYGGGGQNILSMLDVLEEISQADASTGWSLMANITSGGSAAGFLDDAGLEEMYGGAEKAITAGMLGPMGTGVEVEGGFRAGGRYQFGSGSQYATWIGGGFMVLEDGKPRTTPSGDLDQRVGFFPRKDVEMRGNWDVTGLVGSGSYDYEVIESFVPYERTFERLSVSPRRSEPVFHFGNIGIGIAGHAGVVLGLMKRALREVAIITDGKKRAGYPVAVSDYPVFLYQFSRFEARYQAARGYLFQVYGDAEASVASGAGITDEQRARLRQAVTWAHDMAVEVVDFCHLWGGTQAFRNPSVLGRVIRDLGVATQHVLVDPISHVVAATPILDAWKSDDWK